MNQARGGKWPISSLETIEKALRNRLTIAGRSRIMDVLILARGGPDGLGTPGDQWDKNHLLLSCPNGVLELETGHFRDGSPDDLILTHSETEWKGPDEPAPTFERFMMEIMDNDPVMVAFLQRALGYCLSGLSVERVFFIFYGANGQNGKGTLLETLYKILGAFSGEIPSGNPTCSQQGEQRGRGQTGFDDIQGKAACMVFRNEQGSGRLMQP